MGKLLQPATQAATVLVLFAAAGCAQPRQSFEPSSLAPAETPDLGPPPPGSYAIGMPRHIKAGEAYNVRMLTTIDSIMITGEAGPTPEHKIQQKEASGRIDVAAVDHVNRKMDFVFTVKKLTSTKGEILLQPGQVVDIHVEPGQCRCTLRGGTLSNDAQKSLKTFGFSIDTGQEGILGSTQFRKPGESWPITPANKELKMSADGINVEAETPPGQATFKSVETIAGASALRLEGQMTVTVKPQEVFLGLHLDQSQAAMRAKALVPADTQAQALEIENEMTTEIHMSGSIFFRPIKMDAVTRQQVTRKAIVKQPGPEEPRRHDETTKNGLS